MAKKMTLEELARITANGFNDMTKRFDEYDKRFDENDKFHNKLEKRIDNGFLNVNARLDVLERDVREIRSKLSMNMSREEYSEIDDRLTVIEGKLGIKY